MVQPIGSIYFDLFDFDGSSTRKRSQLSPGFSGAKTDKTAAINGLLQRGDQATTVVSGADVGQPSMAWLAYFFLVNNGHW